MGSFRLAVGRRHLYRHCNFTGMFVETVFKSLHLSCGSELHVIPIFLLALTISSSEETFSSASAYYDSVDLYFAVQRLPSSLLLAKQLQSIRVLTVRFPRYSPAFVTFSLEECSSEDFTVISRIYYRDHSQHRQLLYLTRNFATLGRFVPCVQKRSLFSVSDPYW